MVALNGNPCGLKAVRIGEALIDQRVEASGDHHGRWLTLETRRKQGRDPWVCEVFTRTIAIDKPIEKLTVEEIPLRPSLSRSRLT